MTNHIAFIRRVKYALVELLKFGFSSDPDDNDSPKLLIQSPNGTQFWLYVDDNGDMTLESIE